MGKHYGRCTHTVIAAIISASLRRSDVQRAPGEADN